MLVAFCVMWPRPLAVLFYEELRYTWAFGVCPHPFLRLAFVALKNKNVWFLSLRASVTPARFFTGVLHELHARCVRHEREK